MARRLIDASNRYSRIQRFFDPVGNLVREHHAYDVFGVSRSYVWHHSYDELGNRTRTVRPDGHAIDWLMYGSGHVHGLLVDGEERLEIERDDLHREIRRTLSSRIGQSTLYDPAGRIERQTVQREKAPAPLSARRYRYDTAGELTQIEDSRKGVTDYRYDPVGRLLEAIGPGGKERFAFDPASNIVDPVQPDRAPGYSFAARSESTLPASVPKVLGNLLREYAGTHFDYDAQGNLVQKRSSAGTQRFEWDAYDRLSGASVDAPSRHSVSSYFYDPFGRRIAKVVDGVETVFGWDGEALAYESTDERSTHYVYEARSFVPMAQYVAAPVAGIETPVRRAGDRYTPEDDPLQRVPVANGDARLMFYHCDQIGTPLMMTDEAGEVVWEATYKAWGEAPEVIERASAVSGGEAVKNPLRFQGQFVDEETGPHYNRYRYYDPATGRFVSKDPIGLAGGINVYQYAPNAVQWIDPLGLATCPLQKLADRGFSGVSRNENGGLDYSNSNALYNKNGANPIQAITYTGDYETDFQNASIAALGQKTTPRGYVWHHVDDYNPEDNTGAMQFVKQEAHNGIPHVGGVSQYQAATGQKYSHPCRR